MKERSRIWDASFVAGGILLAGFTLRAYRGFDGPSAALSQNKLSPGAADSTIASVKSYLDSHPDDFNAWSRLAIAYYYKGPDSYPDGLNALDKARSLGANNESLFYYAGLMYESLGLPEYAIHELSKYARHHPESVETQVRLANMYLQQKRVDEAYRQYQVLSQENPKDPTLWFNFGLVSKEKADYESALAAFSKAEQLAGGLPEGGLFQKGEVFRLKGAHDQAMVLYGQELAKHPEYLPALKALESEQKALGLLKEARATRAKIASIKPKP